MATTHFNENDLAIVLLGATGGLGLELSPTAGTCSNGNSP